MAVAAGAAGCGVAGSRIQRNSATAASSTVSRPPRNRPRAAPPPLRLHADADALAAIRVAVARGLVLRAGQPGIRRALTDYAGFMGRYIDSVGSRNQAARRALALIDAELARGE